jgi:hypothetical protein
MRYYKQLDSNYYVLIGTGIGGIEIDEEEYTRLASIINSRPTPPDGYGYRLTATEIWEQYALPPVEDDPDVDADAALAEIAEVIG